MLEVDPVVVAQCFVSYVVRWLLMEVGGGAECVFEMIDVFVTAMVMFANCKVRLMRSVGIAEKEKRHA